MSHGHFFTYPPFAALLFSSISFLPWTLLTRVSLAANVVFLLASAWFTFGLLGYRAGRARAGAALLLSAAVFLAEPVLRDIYLGQVELALMALVLWDFSQPDRRWWKGAGIGVAAGIKLVPLIFIPYLLLTRRFRQAAVACRGVRRHGPARVTWCCPPTRTAGGCTRCSPTAAGSSRSSARRATSRCAG